MIVIDSTLPLTITALAVAPTPSPVIVIVGGVVYPLPAFVTKISERPVNDSGVSSRITFLKMPSIS